MNRRNALLALLALGTLPLLSFAQQPGKVYRVAMLTGGLDEAGIDDMIARLVQSKPDVIVVPGTGWAVRTVKVAGDIPIVIATPSRIEPPSNP